MYMRSASRRTEPVRVGARPGFIVGEAVNIPCTVVDLTTFNEWASSEQYPKSVRVSYLNGDIWVDVEMEQLFTHNRVKTRITRVLDLLTVELEFGYLFSDGVRLSNEEANLSTEPDVVLASYRAVKSGRVVLVPGKDSGFVRVDGSPEMVLEIVSDSSVSKDTEWLRDSYWQAKIAEFWLIDVRGEDVKFDLLRRGSKGYIATRKQGGGWLRSPVFKRSFKLSRRLDPLGNPDFTLHVKS
jgi:Uma2 family endonuclease